MRFAALLFAAVLVAASLAAQVVLAQEQPPPAGVPEHALADKLVELLGIALAAAMATALEFARRWLRTKLQRDAVIAGVEKGADPATKSEIKLATEKAGVAIDKPTIARATSRIDRLNGGAA